MFCSTCGNNFDDSAAFCPVCGAANSAAAPVAPVEAPVAPVYFEQSAAIIHENLEDYTVDYAGRYNFTEAMDATYEYVPEPVALIPAKKNWD